MEGKRPVVLTRLASEQVTYIQQHILEEEGQEEAQAFIDDFLDVAFGDIAFYPDQFSRCPIRLGSAYPYRMAHLLGQYRLIFQVLPAQILVLLVLHRDELPFEEEGEE